MRAVNRFYRVSAVQFFCLISIFELKNLESAFARCAIIARRC